LPRTCDNSHGYFRRWLIVKFPNAFPEGDPRRDPFILEQISTTQELSGLLNIAIAGLKRLTQRGYFDEPESSQKAVKEYILSNDSAQFFCSERVQVDDQRRVERGHLFYKYKGFCVEEIFGPCLGVNSTRGFVNYSQLL